jgi:hypothetical protein
VCSRQSAPADALKTEVRFLLRQPLTEKSPSKPQGSLGEAVAVLIVGFFVAARMQLSGK